MSMVQEVILLKGCPGSGKSYFAKNFIQNQTTPWKRVNNDLLRECFDYGHFTKENEGKIKDIRRALIKDFLLSGYNLIVDNVNCGKHQFEEVVKIVEELNIDCLVRERPIYADLEVAIERDKTRTATVGEVVVRKWWNKLGGKGFASYRPRSLEMKKREPIVQNKFLPKAIICDLDGTLAELNGRNPYDASTADQDGICLPVLKTVYSLWLIGHEVIFVSGRPDEYKEPTEKFLVNCLPEGMEYQLYMRKTGDSRKDSVVKREIFVEKILPNRYITLVLDDRDCVVREWRNMGLTCFQVNYGDF